MRTEITLSLELDEGGVMTAVITRDSTRVQQHRLRDQHFIRLQAEVDNQLRQAINELQVKLKQHQLLKKGMR